MIQDVLNLFWYLVKFGAKIGSSMNMNNSLVFCGEWPLRHKILLGLACFIVVFLMVFSAIAWYTGLENVIQWDVVSELHQKIISTAVFNDGTFGFSASSPVYYIKERYLPGQIRVNHLAFQMLLGGGLTGLAFILTGAFRLKGMWFLLFIILTGAVLMTFRLENAFGQTNQTAFLIAFVLVAGLFYVLNSWAPDMDTLRAAGLFSGLFGLLFLAFMYFNQINQPVLSAASYGLISFLVISAVFIFLISHEILAGLIWMVSQTARKGNSSLGQYLLISVIFLLNAVLIYLENSKSIDTSFLILNPLAIYIISAVLGLWGIRKFLEQKSVFSFSASGVWIYTGMAIITTATICFIYATANDSLQEVLEDYIAICQLAAGLAFFVHVLINFIQLFKQGLDVHKVLYRPPFSRLLLARVGALFLVVMFLSFKNFYTYYQTMAGYNNAIGDYYLAEGDLSGAETFYKQSTHYELLNHKANFTLASIALSQDDKINAGFFFKQALEKHPSPFAYAGLSRSLENENLFFDAYFTTQKAVAKFPEDSRLLTNMAYFQGKSQLTDSVLHYLDLAQKNCKNCEVENANFLAFWIENGKKEKLEEMSSRIPAQDYYSNKANRAAISKILGKAGESELLTLSKDSLLDVSRFAFAYNSGTNILTTPKGDADLFLKLQQKEGNGDFQEDLAFIRASQNYFHQNKMNGLKQLSILASQARKNQAVYHQNLGLWFLKEGVYDQAVYQLGAAGDSSSVALLTSQNYKGNLDGRLELQAGAITEKGITLKNVDELVNKAPLNPYLLDKVAAFLGKAKEDNKAYNMLFYATELNPNSALLWQLYTNKAMDMSLTEYAQNGLDKLKTLLPKSEFDQFNTLYQFRKAEKERSSAGF